MTSQDAGPVDIHESSSSDVKPRDYPILSIGRPTNPLVVSKRWKEYLDPTTGRTYYYDRVTKGTQWKKPNGFLTKAELLRPVSCTRIGKSDWKAVSTLNGRKYFFNTATKITAWELPSDFTTPIHDDSSKRNGIDIEEPSDSKSKLSTSQAPHSQSTKVVGRDTSGVGTTIKSVHDLAVDKFDQMLEEQNLDSKSKWTDLSLAVTKDPRFLAIASEVERRSLFLRFIQKTSNQTVKKLQEEIKTRAQSFFHHTMTFDEFKSHMNNVIAYSDLKRISEKAPKQIFEELKEKYQVAFDKAAKAFLGMLDEKVEEKFRRHPGYDWRDFKLSLETDPRYNREQLTGSERQDLFEAWASNIRTDIAKNATPKANSSSSYPRHNVYNNRDSRSSEHRARVSKSDTQQFEDLLRDSIANLYTSWQDMILVLEKDHRFDLPSLDTRDKMEIFQDYIEDAKRAMKKRLLRILDYSSVSPSMQWEEAKLLISDELSKELRYPLSHSDQKEAYQTWVSQLTRREYQR